MIKITEVRQSKCEPCDGKNSFNFLLRFGKEYTYIYINFEFNTYIYIPKHIHGTHCC